VPNNTSIPESGTRDAVNRLLIPALIAKDRPVVYSPFDPA
jgi:hypothetical protein